MKRFLLGTVVLILVAMATLLVVHVGVAKEGSVVVLTVVACIGFLIQISALLNERAKMNALDNSFRYKTAMLLSLLRQRQALN